MSNVVDLKGKPMETPPTTTTEPAQEALPAEVVLVAFLDAVISMHNACDKLDFTRVALRDARGAVYSAPAVMRMIDRHMGFIRTRLSHEITTKPRR